MSKTFTVYLSKWTNEEGKEEIIDEFPELDEAISSAEMWAEEYQEDTKVYQALAVEDGEFIDGYGYRPDSYYENEQLVQVCKYVPD